MFIPSDEPERGICSWLCGFERASGREVKAVILSGVAASFPRPIFGRAATQSKNPSASFGVLSSRGATRHAGSPTRRLSNASSARALQESRARWGAGEGSALPFRLSVGGRTSTAAASRIHSRFTEVQQPAVSFTPPSANTPSPCAFARQARKRLTANQRRGVPMRRIRK